MWSRLVRASCAASSLAGFRDRSTGDMFSVCLRDTDQPWGAQDGDGVPNQYCVARRVPGGELLFLGTIFLPSTPLLLGRACRGDEAIPFLGCDTMVVLL